MNIKENYIFKFLQDCEELSITIDIQDEGYMDEKCVCEVCGSPDIDQQNWVGVNTGLVNELVNPDKWWCNTCEAPTEGITFKKYLEKRDLILKLAKGEAISDKDIEDELYEICDRVHSCCNSECPVYRVNGNKIPDTANDFKVNRGCDCFKSGKNMLAFIRSKV